jgi:hypothetical protein
MIWCMTCLLISHSLIQPVADLLLFCIHHNTNHIICRQKVWGVRCRPPATVEDSEDGSEGSGPARLVDAELAWMAGATVLSTVQAMLPSAGNGDARVGYPDSRAAPMAHPTAAVGPWWPGPWILELQRLSSQEECLSQRHIWPPGAAPSMPLDCFVGG